MVSALSDHYPEYLIEAALLSAFMISACVFATLLFHPASPVREAVTHPMWRRALMGLAMGLTALSIVHTPFGKRSGAHLNPALTFTFFRLGKVKGYDAFFYIFAQFTGGAAGVSVARLVLGELLADSSINYAATVPGSKGLAVAFLAEAAMTFVLMSVVLSVSNSRRFARFTGMCAALLVAVYITFEAPLSGMSMNPARTLASAVPANIWTALWIYFTAPPLGMLLAAETYLRVSGGRSVICAKLHHANHQRCIFRCGYQRTGG